jgi:DNA-binding beta-propeller fold protein YncE
MNRRDVLKAGGLAALTGLTLGRVAAENRVGQKAGREFLLAVNKQGDTVSFFDPADRHRILAELRMPTHPHEVMIDPKRRVAYVSIYGDGIYGNNTHPGHQVYIIGLDTMQVTGVIELAPLEATHAFAWGPKGTLLVACDKSNAVAVVDLDERKVLGTIPTGTHGCHWVLSLPGGEKAYTSNKDTDFMSVLDPVTMKMVRKIPIANGTEGACITLDGKLLYAWDHKDPVLHVIDTKTDKVIESMKVDNLPTVGPFIDHLARAAVTPDGSKVLVSIYPSAKLVIFDAAKMSVLKILDLGRGPMGFAFPKDPSKAYVTNHDAGTVSVVDLDKLDFLETFAASRKPVSGPETIAFFDAREG